MPLKTSITRGGELLPLAWSEFQLVSSVIAVIADSGMRLNPGMKLAELIGPEPAQAIEAGLVPELTVGDGVRMSFMMYMYGIISSIDAPLHSGFALKRRWQFRDERDGELFLLEPGDVFTAYRE
jgi:hypothetical protein